MDCPSCGAPGQTKARCEACGFAFPIEGGGDDDGALSLFLGLVCTTCDAYNDPGTLVCMSCGTALQPPDDDVAQQPFSLAPASAPPSSSSMSSPASSLASPAAGSPLAATAPPLAISSAMTAPPSWMTPPTGSPLSTNLAMKKVDLASLADAGAGLSAPRAPPPPTTSPTSPPTSSPTSSAMSVPPTAPPLAAQAGSNVSGLPLQGRPPSSGPPPAAAKAKCWRCAADLEDNDKFCRNCGARTDGLPSGPPPTSKSSPAPSGAVATQMIQALKLPSVQIGGGGGGLPGATQIIPAFRSGGAAPAAPSPGGPSATMFFGAATSERVAKLILVRGQSQFGNQWRLQAGETIIGRSTGMVLFPDDTALAPRHARLVFRGPDLFLEPEPTLNGAFLRLREPTRLMPGDEFVIGAQRMRLLTEAERPTGVDVTSDNNGTRLLGSMVKPNPPLAVMRVAADPRFHEVYFRAQRLLTIGRIHCDVNFPNDGFVSERHAQLSNEGSHVLLEDLKSRNGTYARITQPTKLLHGDLLLLGDQVLRVELPQR